MARDVILLIGVPSDWPRSLIKMRFCSPSFPPFPQTSLSLSSRLFFFSLCTAFHRSAISDNSLVPLLLSDAIIRYDQTWQASICRTCKIGAHGNALRRHLTEWSHSYRKADWGPILAALNGRPQPMSKTDFPRPLYYTAPISDLPIWDGFAHNLCEHVITSREEMPWKHRKAHRNVLGREQMFYRSVKVQVNSLTTNAQADILTWSRGISGYFWVISPPNPGRISHSFTTTSARIA